MQTRGCLPRKVMQPFSPSHFRPLMLTLRKQSEAGSCEALSRVRWLLETSRNMRPESPERPATCLSGQGWERHIDYII
jgi:hypothetical protein